MLEARALVVELGRRSVLHGVSASMLPGWTAIVGPNGAGKSTLLRALAGLVEPRRGEVRLGGRPLLDWPLRERSQRLAWLAQAGAASGELTARETVALGRLPHQGLLGASTRADEAAIDDAMHATGCTAWARRRLNALSGGERQRVLLARALATGASVLLLDEPTAHLDPPHQVALVKLLRRLAATHTVVTVLHELTLALRADRLLVMRDGAVQADGPSDEPGVRSALQATFEHAIHIDDRGGHAVALPRLED